MIHVVFPKCGTTSFVKMVGEHIATEIDPMTFFRCVDVNQDMTTIYTPATVKRFIEKLEEAVKRYRYVFVRYVNVQILKDMCKANLYPELIMPRSDLKAEWLERAANTPQAETIEREWDSWYTDTWNSGFSSRTLLGPGEYIVDKSFEFNQGELEGANELWRCHRAYHDALSAEDWALRMGKVMPDHKIVVKAREDFYKTLAKSPMPDPVDYAASLMRVAEGSATQFVEGIDKRFKDGKINKVDAMRILGRVINILSTAIAGVKPNGFLPDSHYVSDRIPTDISLGDELTTTIAARVKDACTNVCVRTQA